MLTVSKAHRLYRTAALGND